MNLNQPPPFEMYGPFWPALGLTICLVLLGMGSYVAVLMYRDHRRTQETNEMYKPGPK